MKNWISYRSDIAYERIPEETKVKFKLTRETCLGSQSDDKTCEELIEEVRNVDPEAIIESTSDKYTYES